METKKGNNPAAIAVMIAGIVLALGFAVWNIKRSMSPAAPAKPAAATAAAASPALSSGETAAVQPQAEAVKVAAAPAGEADLAPNANPFAPLAAPVVALNPALNPPRSSALPAPRGRRGAPTLPPFAAWPGSRGLTPLEPLPAPQAGLAPVRPRPQDPAPVLAGTLLGDRASAVFRVNQQLVVVPVGGRLGSWRVLNVAHGNALVRSAGRTVRLSVGGSQTPGVTRTAEEPRPARTAGVQTDITAADPDAAPAQQPGDDAPARDRDVPAALPEAQPRPTDESGAGEDDLPPALPGAN